ncbi:glutamate-rich protein 3 isoform X2 [Ctenopharyngodon idella]|uniref:glutamate-rich protein 3 isoform X2 n=1 Tax=Ctenopharyngodon idella TaxID=7959 RepID=UPI00222F6CED|nr:glutamate-rich protein 3 isoform X2 [Ctenopharyngodon idella]
MSHLNPGLLSAYNSLTDKHLTGYFNNVRIRRHLQKVGLITRSGRIVPDKEYRHKLIQRAHQRHVRECLAQAIFHKVLDMERLHQTEIKRKLEEFARRERIHKMKAERSKRYEDEPVLMLSPRPPTGPKISHARHSGPEGEHSESTESPSSSRPNTAPGKMQRPVRLKPLNSNSATASLKRTSPRHRPPERDSSNDTDQPLSYTLDRDAMRHLTMTDCSSTVSPYRLPVINNYVTPVPPLTKKKERGLRANGTLRGRKLRPTTAPTAATEPSSLQRTSAQSKVTVSMVYFGKSVHLSHDLMDLRDEVKVFQQHCGGENLCVYKGKLSEGEVFQFVSRRHQGFPFSLTFFLNGLQVDRLSSCCEFKHRKGARLGGRHGHFGFCGVEGASPCYKCIIAMGLDKKPTPPQKRVKEELPTSKSPDAKEATDVDEDIDTRSNAEPDTPQEMETEPNGETTGKKKTKDDYEEDFEADDEGPVEDGDEVEEKPSSAASGGEKEPETRDENDINEVKSNSDSDDAKVKRSSSVSYGRTSSLSSSDNDNSEREIVEDTKEVTTANVSEESLHAEEDLTTAETKPEETEVTESSDITLPQAAAEDSGTQDSPVDGMEKSDLEMSEDTDKKEGTEGEQSGEDAKPEDKPQENEPERAKSMQEKLAEAIFKESQCSSEPEFSDTSTEEDEGASVKTQQDGQGTEMESFTSPQPSNTQDDIPEKSEAKTRESVCEERVQEAHVHTEEEIGETQEPTLDIEEMQKEEQSERTNEVEQPDEREEVKTETEDMQEKDKDGDNTNAEVNTESNEEEKDSLVQEPETHTEMLDAGNTDTEFPEMEEMDLVSHTENDTETGADDTQRQRDADDADQNIERRSDGQPDRDEREDLSDEAGDDRSPGEMAQKTDGKVDCEGSVGKEEDGEKSSEEKDETKVEDTSEDLGVEESEKPGNEEIQVGEKENELECKEEDGEKSIEAKNETKVEDTSEDLEIEEAEKPENEEIQVGEKENELEVKEEDGEKSSEEKYETKVEDSSEDLGVEEAEKPGNEEIQVDEKENELEVKEEDGEKSSEEKYETKVEDSSEDLAVEEAEKPGNEEIQVGEKENELEGDQESKVEDKQNKDSTEKDNDGVNADHKENEDGELSSEALNRLNESRESQDVRAEGNEKEDDGVNDEQKETEDGEQVRNILSDGAEEEGPEKTNSEVEIEGEINKGKDEKMEDRSQEGEEEEDRKMDEMAEGTDGNYVENEAKDKEHEDELETGEKLIEEPEKEMADINEISENTLEAGDGSGENTVQKLEDIFEDQNEESVSQEEQNEMGSSRAPKDDTEASTKEELSEPAEVNNDLQDSNIDAENGEKQDVGLEEAEKVEDYLQEETQDKSEGETGDSAQEVIDDNEKPETDKDMKEEENDNGKEHEIENKLNAEVIPSEIESQLGGEHEDQGSDNQNADKEDDKEEADKESETSATTFIENITPQITQTIVNKDTESEIVSAETKVTAEEPELKGTDDELRSRDAPEGMDSETAQPLDLVSNWINIHQESKYFQTFIEPLDEEGLISEETEERLNGEVLDATDAPPSTDIGGLDETLKSRDETATPIRNNLNEYTESVVESLKSETKVEAVEADAYSNHSKDSIQSSTKDERVQEAGDTRGSLVTSWSRESNNEDTIQKDTARQETLTSGDVINMGTTATSEDIQDKAPSETEQQNVSRIVDLNVKESEQCDQQNMTDETKHLAQTEEASNKETLESLEDNLKPEHEPQSENIEPQSPTITVITDLTIVNKSENGSQDDTASVDFHSRQSDGSRNVNGNRRTKVSDGQFKQTLSTETLSTFSLDDSRFFGPAGYPRLTTAHTENSY